METPSKKNSRVINRLTGRSFPNKRFTEWHDAASLEIREQMVTRTITERIAFPCNISFIFTHGDNRRRDSDNQTSSILDLLIDCGILLDDDWKIVRQMTIENRYQKNNAGCLIEITALD